MKCPYCENEMQVGILRGDGRSAVKFLKNGEKHSFMDTMEGKGRIDTKYSWSIFTIDANFCDKCKKMIIDTDVQK